MKIRLIHFFLAATIPIAFVWPDTITINLPGLPQTAKPLELALIQSGSFVMGYAEDEPGSYPDLEWPAHPVTLSKDFYLGKYEITQSQWMAVMGETPSRQEIVGDDYPVYYVSWRECQDFTQRLSEMASGDFRLPTEAEWEYACRADTTTRFSYGDGPDFGDAYHYYDEPDRYMWWFGNNDPEGPKPAGMKSPNPWGLYDMHGNVYEWCSDWWEPPYTRGAQTDPQGPPFGEMHVSRSGHWFGSVFHCRSAFRFTERDADLQGGIFWGFRIVMEIEGSSVDKWELYE